MHFKRRVTTDTKFAQRSKDQCIVGLVVLRGLSPISIGAAFIIKWIKGHNQISCRN